MTVSFIIVAYNEETTINSLLEDIKKQDYLHKKIEVLLVDGNSTDSTKRIMFEFAKKTTDFRRIVILDNPKRTLPCGWNVALDEAQGDVILRVDAHASIPHDFVSNNIRCLELGEKICGGYRPNIIDEDTSWKRTLLLAESSMFGSSIAPYRRNKKKSYVNSIFHGAYCKEVFNRVGKYNERLNRTEDNEIHYRMRKAGYRICFDPLIISYQHTRNTMKTMLKQKYLNGYWIGKTVKICPKCLAPYHFVPGLFILGILVTTLFAVLHIWWPFFLMWVSYWGLSFLTMFVVILGERKIFWSYLLLPILFFLLHISYGVGTLIGLLSKN